MAYQPKHLCRWTRPQNYMGASWFDYYGAGFGRSRDSDCLEESNFAVALRALGGESETVLVVSERHWAVGWVEWIAIHETDEKALEIADDLREQCEDYPILDESDFSEREWERACEAWRSFAIRDRMHAIERHGDSSPCAFLQARYDDFGRVSDPSGSLLSYLSE